MILRIFSTLLILCSICSFVAFKPLSIDVVLLGIGFFCFASSFIFYYKVVHEIFVVFALILLLTIVFSSNLNFIAALMFKFLLLLLTLLFLVMYSVELGEHKKCTWTGGVEYSLFLVLFMLLFINRYIAITS